MHYNTIIVYLHIDNNKNEIEMKTSTTIMHLTNIKGQNSFCNEKKEARRSQLNMNEKELEIMTQWKFNRFSFPAPIEVIAIRKRFIGSWGELKELI